MRIVPRIPSDLLECSEPQYSAIQRYDLYSMCIFCRDFSIIFFDQSSDLFFESQVFWSSVFESTDKCLHLTVRYIGKMIELNYMNPSMKELEPDTKGRKSEIG